MVDIIKIVLFVLGMLLLIDVAQSDGGLTAHSLAESLNRLYLTLTGGS